ncbi:MAG: hypothetical protein NZ484_00825 [Patescibacteria group bacterium]|nr:hypothetical protein [Patescibacteria group bacterium]MDW8279762.1 hypothetical protein [bacterium]
MKDKKAGCFCLKYQQNIPEAKVLSWCLRWNCRHLRSEFKRGTKKMRNKKTAQSGQTVIIEIKTELIIFEEEKDSST